jgi:predicted ATPase
MRGTHPFGNLISQFRARKHGLTQARLAEMTGYDPAVITRMCAGQKDLTGTQARERVLRIIQALDDSGALNGVDEANGLLEAADLPPLYAGNEDEAALSRRLAIHQRDMARSEVQPRRTATHAPPAQLTSFVGREPEIERVKQLLTEPGSGSKTARTRPASRLVTLIGPGGVGKTRLAIEVAAMLSDAFADGVWWVSLAALGDSTLVVQSLIDSFALGRQKTGPALDVLADHLDRRRALLVLDNCEHVIDACANMVAHLTGRCTDLQILCTSREALLVPGELTLYVPPLATPRSAKAKMDANALLEFDSVRLFVERAQAMHPGFVLTPANAAAVARICEYLDGIPLAVELSAALLQAMTVEEVAVRIDNRFSLLKGGYRTVMPRHQTLSNAVDWSYELLTALEQILLARLSIFSGSWSADSATAICSAGALTHADVLPTLRQLVNKSLVVIDEQRGASTRYRLLKTIQEYAAEKLRDQQEKTTMQDNQLYHLVQVAEAAVAAHADANANASAKTELLEQQDDVRAALVYAEQQGKFDTLLRLTAALQHFWRGQGVRDEGTRRMRHALALATTAPAGPRVAVMYAWAGGGWTFDSDIPHLAELTPQAQECLEACRIANNPLGVAQALTVLGSAAYAAEKDYPKARGLLEEALSVFEQANDQRGIQIAREKIAYVLMEGYPDQTMAWMQSTLKHYEASGNQLRIATTLADIALSAEPSDAGSPRVVDLWRRAVAAARSGGDVGLASEFLSGLGDAELAAGERAQAAEHFAQSLDIACDMDSVVGILHVLERLWGSDADRAQSMISAYLQNKHSVEVNQPITLHEAVQLINSTATTQ